MLGVGIADALGMIGAMLIVVAYFLLQTGRLEARSLAYSVANGLGAAAILFSLFFAFNLSAFAIEFFWLLISLYGVVRALQARSASAHLQQQDSDAAR